MKQLIVLLAILPLFSFAQTKSAPYAKVIAVAEDSIHKFMTLRKIPGASVTVSIDGKIVWSEGFGYADLEQKVSVSPAKTKFRIGSISKSLTAAALARLYEQEKIILDSSVYFYLPEYPKHQYRPTVRQVAGHIGGIRSYKGDEFFITKHYNTVSDALSVFENDSLNSRPGSKYEYSSHGFNLLSAVIEKAAHREFLQYIKSEVFDQLKLTNTTPDLNDSIIDYRTRFYVVRNNVWINAPYVDNSYKWGGGGFISCSEDIARFANALLRNDFLKNETIKLFTTPQKLSNGSYTNYGMGFASGKDSKGIAYFGHSGGSVGGTTNMVIYPESKITVVVLTNLSDARLGEIASHVAHLFMTNTSTLKK
jgi:CubicO group peptidase (beta-lactamase class C family)